MAALPQLQAERQLLLIEAVSLPHMDKEARREVFSRLRSSLGHVERPRAATLGDVSSLGITVERVNADGSPADDGTSPDKTEGE